MKVISNSPAAYIQADKKEKSLNNSVSAQRTAVSQGNQLGLYLYNLAQTNRASVIKFTNGHVDFDKSIDRYYRFKPDKYQIEAAKSIYEGNNTVVTAPTGTGKTLIAEYAIKKNLAEGKKTFYTTPLKALTNQKYLDFCELYGKENVGIMTGDIKHNINAPVIVMTTEIYRNMLKPNLNQDEKTAMQNLKTVVFDEFHYMNDPERGTTWEESIMFSPPEIQLLALSATAKNGDKITGWIRGINSSKDAALVNVPPEERHVPLKFYTYSKNSDTLVPLVSTKVSVSKLEKELDSGTLPEKTKQALIDLGKKIYPDSEEDPAAGVLALLEANNNSRKEIDENDLSKKLQYMGINSDEADKLSMMLVDKKTQAINQYAVSAAKAPVTSKSADDSKAEYYHTVMGMLDNLSGDNKLKKDEMSLKRCKETEDPLAKTKDLKLPAIVFVFSKKDCDTLAQLYSQHLVENKKYMSRDKVAEMKDNSKQISEIIKKYKDQGLILGTEFDKHSKEALLNGVAVHHAGMLPAYKSLVEELFQKKLVNVVFATETLAAGINMPAKTTVLTSLSKPAGSNADGEMKTRNITISEFQQMAGRAGRRGIDKIGNVIVINRDSETADKAYALATSPPDEIKSNFKPSYGFLNSFLMEQRYMEGLDTVIDKSFMIYQAEDPAKESETVKGKFDMMKNVLEREGFIEPGKDGSYCVNPKGIVASKVRGVNEVLFSQLIFDGAFNDLSPAELAGAVASVSENSKTHIDLDTVESQHKYGRFEQLDGSLSKIKAKASNLQKVQKEEILKAKGIDLSKLSAKEAKAAEDAADYQAEVHVNDKIAEYITHWALSEKQMPVDEKGQPVKTEWSKLVNDLKDQKLISYEGDFFKTVNSTVDLLNQLSELSEQAGKLEKDPEAKRNAEELSKKAKEAADILQKPPVRELLAEKETTKDLTLSKK